MPLTGVQASTVGLDAIVLTGQSKRATSLTPGARQGGRSSIRPPYVLCLGRKHEGPGPHPGTGTEQSVHGGGGGGTSTTSPLDSEVAARVAKIGLKPEVASDLLKSYELDESGRIKVEGKYKRPVLTEYGKQRAARVAQFIESELAKGEGQSQYDTTNIYGRDQATGLATTPERREMQERIIQEYLDTQISLGARKEGKALITGGLGGSGKTTVLKTLFPLVKDPKTGEQTPQGYVLINPDVLKGIIHAANGSPDVPDLTPGEASVFLHEEASAMAKEISRRATAEGYNVVWDFTMGSVSSTMQRIEDLVDNQGPTYDVELMFVDIPTDKSIESAQQRWHGGNARGMNEIIQGVNADGFMGRFVPETFIRKANGNNKKAFKKIVDNWDEAVAEYEAKRKRESPALRSYRITDWSLYTNNYAPDGTRSIDWTEGTRKAVAA